LAKETNPKKILNDETWQSLAPAPRRPSIGNGKAISSNLETDGHVCY